MSKAFAALISELARKQARLTTLFSSKNKDLAATLILTLITAFAWIGFRGTLLSRKHPKDSFADKAVETISPGLRIDITEEL